MSGIDIQDTLLANAPTFSGREFCKQRSGGRYRVCININPLRRSSTQPQRRHHRQPGTTADIEKFLAGKVLSGYQFGQAPGRFSNLLFVNQAGIGLPVFSEFKVSGCLFQICCGNFCPYRDESRSTTHPQSLSSLAFVLPAPDLATNVIFWFCSEEPCPQWKAQCSW